MQLYYVRVIQLFEDLYLAVGALGVRRVLKRIEDLLECHNLLGALLLYLPHVPVRPRAHFLEYAESAHYVAFDMRGLTLRHNLNNYNG